MSAPAPTPPEAVRVLGLFPHPDDESYAAGAALAQCAAAGLPTGVLCATRGEAGFDRRGYARRPAELAQRRSAELLRACRALGVELVGFLDWPDGDLVAVDPDVAQRSLRSWFATWRPTVLLTLGADGVYGSRDHRSIERMARMAIRATAGLAHWSCVFPRHHFEPLRRNLLRSAFDVIDYHGPLGVDAPSVPLRIDVGTARDRKLAALRCHESQLRNGDPHTLLGSGLLDPLLIEEWYAPGACESST